MELNKFYIGNNVEIMKNEILDESIDLIITSPPYDDLRDYDGYSFDYKEVMSQCYKVLKKGGVMVWVVNDKTIKGSESGTSFRQALYAIDIGFNLHDTMLYEKNTSSFPAKRDGNRYTQIFEYMFVFSKGKPKTANLICDKENKCYGNTNWGKNTDRQKDGSLLEKKNIKEVPKFSPRNNIWKYTVGGGIAQKDKIAYNHPATFPEQLALDHILSWSNEGDVVMDPMCGSGTVCKQALLSNRKFIGIDISDKYINEICIPRLQKYI